MKITVQCHDGPRQIDAAVFGEWACHPGIDRETDEPRLDWWVVTHVPTGRCIASEVSQLSGVRAVEIARALGERAGGVIPASLPPDFDDSGGASLPGYEQMKRSIRSVLFDLGVIGEPP